MISIFLTLAEEHVLMLRLADDVEAAWKRADEQAARAARGALLILHRALERHEKIEETLFAGRPVPREAAKISVAIRAEHRELEDLRRETKGVLGRSGGSGGENLRTVALVLVRRLRSHFKAEEALLWPLFSALPGRSVARTLARRARTQVRSLEQDVEAYRTAVDHYV